MNGITIEPTTSKPANASTSASKDDQNGNIITCTVPKFYWQPPRDAEKHPYMPHASEGSQYLRDFILGVNDGLVSTFLLVIGVIGGGGNCATALLSGLASAIAGSCAMGMTLTIFRHSSFIFHVSFPLCTQLYFNHYFIIYMG